MANDTEVQPALTPEEWAEGRATATVRDDTHNEDVVVERYTGGVRIEIGDAFELMGAVVERPHALAALALHGQPFGFTREDFYVLYDALHWSEDVTVYRVSEEKRARLLSLAARIAALLPPEEK